MNGRLIGYFLIAILILGLGGVSARWVKYKHFPSETLSEETFIIDKSLVKNAQANKTYYGTVKITTSRKAGSYPTVDVTVTRDTLSVEEGGYFGVPN